MTRLARLARPVALVLAAVGVLAVLALAAVVALGVVTWWALGRLVAGAADTARSVERVWREG